MAIVSIILPTFNRPLLLFRTLQSVLNQTIQDFEVLIVNDGGEPIDQIVRAFHDSRLRLINHSVNKKMSAARNTALKEASGKYIAYLDDDDLYYPTHLELLIKALETHPQFQVAYTDWTYAYAHFNHGTPIIDQIKEGAFEISWPDILIHNRLPPVTLMHTRSIIEAVGLYDETLHRHEDWDLYIRMAQKSEFLHLPEATAEYMISQDHGQMISSWMGPFLETMQRIHLRYLKDAEQYPGILERQLDVRYALRARCMEQLELMSLEELAAPHLKEWLKQIVASSRLLGEEDLREASAFVGYFKRYFPDEKVD